MKHLSRVVVIVIHFCIETKFILANQLFYPSADASLRRDKRNKNFGDQTHITITKQETARSRVALMKFDTKDIYKDENTTASLVLYISGTDGDQDYRTVSICKVEEDFEEHEVTWKTYDPSCSEQSLSFDVHRDDVGKTGQINVTDLIDASEDMLVLALQVEDGGHVKLASKDHPHNARMPRLLVSQTDSVYEL